jgi:small subunit ribosomal protein S19e
MTTHNIKPAELIERAVKRLKELEEFKAPEWSKFVKTSTARERPPVQEDWWYFRVASIMRKLYLLGPIGVNKLKRKYGGRKNRGHKPEKYFEGSGKIIRTILIQLEKAGLAEKKEVKNHKGRVLTKKGKSFLDKNG